MGSTVRWAFNVGMWKPTEEQWMTAASCIQRNEFDRIRSFVFKKDAKASLIGRLLMRKFAVSILGLQNKNVLFERTEHGKPYLVNDVPITTASAPSFNVSHQGSYCILAAELDRPVGVDVMKLEYTGGKPVPEFFRLMKRQFTMKEWTTILESQNEYDQLFKFFRHWCLKESYVKALGVGIAFDLQRVAFQLKSKLLSRDKITTDTIMEVDSTPVKNWSFEESMLDDNHCVSVAIGPSVQTSVELLQQNSPDCALPLTFKLLSFEEIIWNLAPLNQIDVHHWSEFSTKDEKPS